MVESAGRIVGALGGRTRNRENTSSADEASWPSSPSMGRGFHAPPSSSLGLDASTAEPSALGNGLSAEAAARLQSSLDGCDANHRLELSADAPLGRRLGSPPEIQG